MAFTAGGGSAGLQLSQVARGVYSGPSLLLDLRLTPRKVSGFRGFTWSQKPGLRKIGLNEQPTYRLRENEFGENFVDRFNSGVYEVTPVR